jgi:HD superfamily phosphohydrolase
MSGQKVYRIRDPVHNLIEFGNTRNADQYQLEHILWEVIKTRPFQRLRRVKQLGFSELVFPGATHTRFAHSIGVFHTARKLAAVIDRSVGGFDYKAQKCRVAMAAAMVHDLGHGMFSHAFESVMKSLGLTETKHERVSQRIIRDTEISVLLNQISESFAEEVASLVAIKPPRNFYDAIVASQFDADRLDYIQRDRLMSGVGSGAIDVEWLLQNLEVEHVTVSSDDDAGGSVQTFALSAKAYHVAESYVLALFHLYPNVYFHKATRGAEKVFEALILKLFQLVREGNTAKTGLPANHPLISFAITPENLDRILDLDDATLWGALPTLTEAMDNEISRLARQLRDRRLLRCIDIWNMAAEELPPERREDRGSRRARLGRIDKACDRVIELKAELPDALFDTYSRNPYERFQKADTVFNQIHIKQPGGIRDMAQLSAVVASAEPFRICRAYIRRDDKNTETVLRNIVRTSIGSRSDGEM